MSADCLRNKKLSLVVRDEQYTIENKGGESSVDDWTDNCNALIVLSANFLFLPHSFSSTIHQVFVLLCIVAALLVVYCDAGAKIPFPYYQRLVSKSSS